MALGKNMSIDALQTLVEGRTPEGTRRAATTPRAGRGAPADPRFAAMLSKGGGAGSASLASMVAGAGAPQAALAAGGGEADNALAADERASRAAMDIVNSRALATLAKVMEGGSGPLDSLRGAMTSRNLMALSGNLDMAMTGGMPAAGGNTPGAGGIGTVAGGPGRGGAGPAAQRRTRQGQDRSGRAGAGASGGAGDIGGLSAQFESGEDGIAAIGYDRHGGTSYGKYQISSRAGTMDRFIDFARGAAPDIAARLEAAGPANTGGKNGEMPQVWRAIAQEDPARFEALQERFIRDSHYTPALQAISRAAGLDKGNLSPALREVLWSTAVQHGPAGATRIFSRALENMADAKPTAGGEPAVQPATARAGRDFEKQLIREVYAVRSGQFGSSTERVQAAVQTRLDREMKLALAMSDGRNRA